MQLPYLVRAVVSHADDLTREVIDDLRNNPDTPSMRRLTDDESQRRIADVYANLSAWLTDRAVHDTRLTYRQLGAQRCEDGVPAAEMVFAILAVKRHLLEFIRRNANTESVTQMYEEEELFSAISHFFDVAVYSAVQGHESARAAGRWNPMRHLADMTR
jgi:hypothetical protein